MYIIIGKITIYASMKKIKVMDDDMDSSFIDFIYLSPMIAIIITHAE